MNMESRAGRVAVVGLLLTAMSVGCQNMNNTQKGAALGTGLGALTGAIVGHQSGNRDKGALIGAVAGGLGGGLLGHAQDKADERDEAIRHAQHVQQNARANALALTNREVINMTHQGVPDDQIIRAIQQRGGRFDTSADGLIYLNKQGVSRNVIQVMQQYDRQLR
ncbi:MAG: hypothetical protein Tsb009_24930 [Planctomycetaceae bacterium]